MQVFGGAVGFPDKDFQGIERADIGRIGVAGLD